MSRLTSTSTDLGSCSWEPASTRHRHRLRSEWSIRPVFVYASWHPTPPSTSRWSAWRGGSHRRAVHQKKSQPSFSRNASTFHSGRSNITTSHRQSPSRTPLGLQVRLPDCQWPSSRLQYSALFSFPGRSNNSPSSSLVINVVLIVFSRRLSSADVVSSL